MLPLDTSAMILSFNDFSKNITIPFPILAAGIGISIIPGLNKTNKFVVFIPGFTTDITLHSMNLIRQSFQNDTYVMILHDPTYTNLFNSNNIVANYERAVLYACSIGKGIADVLVTLASNGISHNKIHIIGHSLGAHIAGCAGESFEEKTGNKIAKISGVDPIHPCFNEISNQLRSGQAKFVDTYRCNAYGFGADKSLVDAVFVVNNGKTQPNCLSSPIPDLAVSTAAGLCSHMACENFYFMTVSQPNLFKAYQCDSYDNFKQGKCAKNKQTVAGYWAPSNATGIYYTSTAGHMINQL
ncbi:pancreatic lipase-related protein 2-like [Aricia agestis]|uniref:pancreatic lipase-related protein 2-like n=1 Tax=Aricia agestis TaxID=91739 RepID=UPI001C2086E4|nr:pancreatic lipase-related protein 2-like [Aricia agestis]